VRAESTIFVKFFHNQQTSVGRRSGTNATVFRSTKYGVRQTPVTDRGILLVVVYYHYQATVDG
jgi:hypothetical protein